MTATVPGSPSRKLAYLAASQLYEEAAIAHPGLRSDEQAPFCSIPYLKWALIQICVFAGYWEEDKLQRWIGWCQGISNCLGLTSVEQERDRIRTLKAHIGTQTPTPEELEKLKQACLDTRPLIVADLSPNINGTGAQELLAALRDRIPLIYNAIDLERCLDEVGLIRDELKTRLTTELRGEQK
jgi:hypothetical protein